MLSYLTANVLFCCVRSVPFKHDILCLNPAQVHIFKHLFPPCISYYLLTFYTVSPFKYSQMVLNCYEVNETLKSALKLPPNQIHVVVF